MLPEIRDYHALRDAFHWKIPARFNMATPIADVWALKDPQRPAIYDVAKDGTVKVLTFGEMAVQSRKLADILVRHGVQRGDRVAVLMQQGHMVPVTHVAVYRMGGIALPLAVMFGVDALRYRLQNAGVKAVVADGFGLAKLKQIQHELPDLDLILSVEGDDGSALGLPRLMETASSDFRTVDTSCDDPALMIYTSGTTGQPKGALHAHRVLYGHLPGVQFAHDFMPKQGDRLWTPADWAWIGGLMNILMTGLTCGVPVVAHRFEKFDPEEALVFLARHEIRNTFIAPTALRMLRTISRPKERFGVELRTLASGGEMLGEEVYAWGREALGLTINEFYGQTECNLIVGACAAAGVSRSGSMGRPVPGHTVRIIRDDGGFCEPGELGHIAAQRPDPAMFLEYWQQPEATKAKFIGNWMTTGDQGTVDDDGYIHFVGRDDDVITSAGYRIGPGEIEDCLISHPAVANAAVVGKPDALRTEIVKAFIVLKTDLQPSDALREEIRAHVKTRLSAHEYPREIDFIKELPLTTTGKVIRRLLREQS